MLVKLAMAQKDQVGSLAEAGHKPLQPLLLFMSKSKPYHAHEKDPKHQELFVGIKSRPSQNDESVQIQPRHVATSPKFEVLCITSRSYKLGTTKKTISNCRAELNSSRQSATKTLR